MRLPTLFLAILGLSGCAHAAGTPSARPNVIILLTDDQGTLDANCYGSTDLITPNIDNYRHHFLHGRGFHDLWEGNQEIFRPEEYFPDLLIKRAVDDHSSGYPRGHCYLAHEVLHFGWAQDWAVRRGDWKLIRQLDKETNKVILSLRNLADPKPEVKDHAGERPEIVKELTALHEAWEKDVNAK